MSWPLKCVQVNRALHGTSWEAVARPAMLPFPREIRGANNDGRARSCCMKGLQWWGIALCSCVPSMSHAHPEKYVHVATSGFLPFLWEGSTSTWVCQSSGLKGRAESVHVIHGSRHGTELRLGTKYCLIAPFANLPLPSDCRGCQAKEDRPPSV